MVSTYMLAGLFRYQICWGIISSQLWFTDGDLLPYTIKKKLNAGYSTQRRGRVFGRTNQVTSDSIGRIVDFQIQKGEGDLRSHIVSMGRKWQDELACAPVMIFDREGYGAELFFALSENKISFVTWEKNIDTQKLEASEAEHLGEEFKLNGKLYRIFEGEKNFVYTLKNARHQELTLRRCYIWNATSHRRALALANAGPEKLSTKDCALAILNRWGASENTFKHLSGKHLLHYQPGFVFTDSKKRQIVNSKHKESKALITSLKRQLNKLYKKFSKSEKPFNKESNHRQNSAHQRLKQEISDQEAQIDFLNLKVKELPEKIDISRLEDYDYFECICNESKKLFDFVTSSVLDAPKQMAEWLLPFYESKNEYIDLFYAITNCHGWIKSEEHKVTVRLGLFTARPMGSPGTGMPQTDRVRGNDAARQVTCN
ncbi:MAG: hypothetical protein GY874_24330 [Desulfobacteraceae bacterium]|nr:hypothetical protein [Desulfobacteraceae bacterium]